MLFMLFYSQRCADVDPGDVPTFTEAPAPESAPASTPASAPPPAASSPAMSPAMPPAMPGMPSMPSANGDNGGNGVSRREASRKTATQLRSELNRLREAGSAPNQKRCYLKSLKQQTKFLKPLSQAPLQLQDAAVTDEHA